MINNKLLLGMVIISIIYTGCEEKQTTPITNSSVVEKKDKVIEKKTVPKIIEKVESSVQKEDVITPIIKKVQAIAAAPNGEILYKKCSGCHGQKAEKEALNKSAVIKDWNAEKIANALKGYKKGTYGGEMKGVMKGQVISMSDEEIDLVSKHIATFK